MFKRFLAAALCLILLLVLPAQAELAVHYLDVGQGDAAIVLCDGKSLMIDGGDPSASRFVYSYLQNTLKLSHPDYMVATHPDADPIGGLSAALNACSVGTVYSPTTEDDSKTFSSLVKYTEEQGKSLTVPQAGTTFSLGGAEVQILAPIHAHSEDNNNSIILRIVYGNTAFLFTGDAEADEEQDLLDSECVCASTVLKVGHHGSQSSTTQRFLNAVQPQYAIISVGENTYGHPDNGVLARLDAAKVQTYRTDVNGTIICLSDGKNLQFSGDRLVQLQSEIKVYGRGDKGEEVRKIQQKLIDLGYLSGSADGDFGKQTEKAVKAFQQNEGLAETGVCDARTSNRLFAAKKPAVTVKPTATPKPTSAPSSGSSQSYIGNKNTKKFHYPYCSSVDQMKSSNKVSLPDRDAAISKGYVPCKRCDP